MGQGAPWYHPPFELFSSLINDLDTPVPHRYTPDPGLPALREALARKLHQENSIPTQAQQVVITPGANQAFFNVLLTITDPGDEIILLSPYYFNHLMACDAVNVTPVVISLNSDFSLPITTIENAIREKTRAIVLVNPGNPTGKVHTTEELSQLSAVIGEKDILVISDETYEYFTYGDSQHTSIGSFGPISDQVITIGSFSKTYGIPGWRLGYYRAHNIIINASIKIQDTIGICAPAPAQLLALELLKQRTSVIPSFVHAMEENYGLSRDLLAEVEWLTPTPSEGAYYLFPKQETGIQSEQLSKRLILEKLVYIVPGAGFGQSWKNHMRISFANLQAEEMKEAFSRLRSFQY